MLNRRGSSKRILMTMILCVSSGLLVGCSGGAPGAATGGAMPGLMTGTGQQAGGTERMSGNQLASFAPPAI